MLLSSTVSYYILLGLPLVEERASLESTSACWFSDRDYRWFQSFSVNRRTCETGGHMRPYTILSLVFSVKLNEDLLETE